MTFLAIICKTSEITIITGAALVADYATDVKSA